MRTTINVSDSVMEGLMAVTGAKTKTEAVNKALADYVRLKKRQQLIDLSGRIHVEEPRKVDTHEP